MRNIERVRSSIWYELGFTILALVSVGLFIYELFSQLPSSALKQYVSIDLMIAYLFLLDFFAGLLLAPSKRAYVKENWILLLSSVPMHEGVFRALRLLRILRILRIIRSLLQLRQLSKKRRKKPTARH